MKSNKLKLLISALGLSATVLACSSETSSIDTDRLEIEMNEFADSKENDMEIEGEIQNLYTEWSNYDVATNSYIVDVDSMFSKYLLRNDKGDKDYSLEVDKAKKELYDVLGSEIHVKEMNDEFVVLKGLNNNEIKIGTNNKHNYFTMYYQMDDNKVVQLMGTSNQYDYAYEVYGDSLYNVSKYCESMVNNEKKFVSIVFRRENDLLFSIMLDYNNKQMHMTSLSGTAKFNITDDELKEIYRILKYYDKSNYINDFLFSNEDMINGYLEEIKNEYLYDEMSNSYKLLLEDRKQLVKVKN